MKGTCEKPHPSTSLRAGFLAHKAREKWGTRRISVVPPGLVLLSLAFPALKRWAIIVRPSGGRGVHQAHGRGASLRGTAEGGCPHKDP